MARASSAIVKEMLPLIDSTYAVRVKSILLNSISLYKDNTKKEWFESAIGVTGAKSEVETKAALLADYTAASIDALTRKPSCGRRYQHMHLDGQIILAT